MDGLRAEEGDGPAVKPDIPLRPSLTALLSETIPPGQQSPPGEKAAPQATEAGRTQCPEETFKWIKCLFLMRQKE